MERESLQAQRMKKYDQFRRVHEQRLEQLDALARQIIPVTVHPKCVGATARYPAHFAWGWGEGWMALVLQSLRLGHASF